ncbi:glycosyltransferase family 39 protein, partial [bacterium]|nr:glycosyltransferase family 39 protein [bacterium]
MVNVSGNSKWTGIWALVFLGMAGLIQWLLVTKNPWLAAFLFILTSIIVLKTPKTIWNIPQNDSSDPNSSLNTIDIVLLCLLWVVALLLRFHVLNENYSISDLSARFVYTSLQILDGNFIFPCIVPYEYDEILISWIFAPFLKIFGHDWTTVKYIAASINTLLVPVTYCWMRRYFTRTAAFIASGLIVLCGYFQFCDPLISMSRFSLVTIILFLLICCLERTFQSSGKIWWILPSAFLTATSMYMHSTGRVALVLVSIFGLYRVFSGSITERRMNIFKLLGVMTITLLLFTPFVIYAYDNPRYFFFKRRQIFGLHEAYPFFWTGLWHNMISVLSNFNYRAQHHMHFPENLSLLRPITGAGAIGFFWLMLRNWKDPRYILWITSLVLTVIPLMMITPGHWRGLYFSPSVAFLTLGAGLFYYWVIISAVPLISSLNSVTSLKNQSRSHVFIVICCAIIFIGTIAFIRIPTFYAGSRAPVLPDTVTLLYMDLKDEPDVPHYFSSTIAEMKPGFAIFEFLGSAWFSEYAVLEFEPLRV